MNIEQPLDITKLLDDPAYRLAEIELFNWGPFSDFNQAEIDPYGTAVIGQTGSGKTTLVDAIMTLIAQTPKYNLASTGGHESDRDLMSYIRGVTGAGNESENNDHILRPGKTVTGISTHFKNTKDSIHLTGIFWIDGSSSATADLKRAWLFTVNSQLKLSDYLHVFQDGGMRGLKQLGKTQDGIKVYDSKKPYLAQIRRYFEVSDNAFTLLNRAAGLKQLNSIDDLFRELVLDDHSAFKRATEVAAEFDDLASIHTELETARKQQQSLVPIKIEYDKFVKNSDTLSEKEKLLSIFPKWFATHLYLLWQNQENTAAKKIEQYQQIAMTLNEKINLAQNNTDQARDIYSKLGGASIEQLQQQIEQQRSIVNTCKLHTADYQQLTTRLNLDAEITTSSLAKNQQQAEKLQIEQQTLFEEKEQFAWDQGARQQQQRDCVKELEEEIENIKKSPGSNIPSHFQLFRRELAQTLDIDEHELPFAAELMQVKPEQSIWRGAIERAVGSHRLRLLVPPENYSAALSWVNNRNNRLHVRLLNAKAPEKPATFLNDGFTRKLNFKSHTQREALKSLLANIDRHCVDDPESLKHLSHAMTKEGLMSGKQGFSEKQDQRKLDQDWMTGFDNRDRLAHLGQDLNKANSALIAFKHIYEQARHTCSEIQQNITLLQQLCNLDFNQIDISTAETQLKTYQSNLQSLLDPDSDTAKAKENWEQAKQHLKNCDELATNNKITIALSEKDVNHAKQQKESAVQRVGDGISNEQQTLADNYFNKPIEQDIPKLSDIEREAVKNLQITINKFKDKVSDNTSRLARLMEKAKTIDTGALSEADTQMEDIPVYLDQLNILNEEALPEKQSRFLAYLNQSSDQGVTQLLSNIENEVSMIEERIDELNQTMRRVEYQPGHYLRLEPRRITHDSLKTLQKSQRILRTAALKADNGESHYRALSDLVALLRDAVDRKKTLSAKALLDPRYRLQFFISVINKTDGRVIETRTGSQGGSGGEKEIIASYILTASLSYALCPAGSSSPLFSTIILDEAFSKSSRAVAARIIFALREFGLHPLFITPNKEIRLLRDHTRSAILIHRSKQTATMTTLSWEELSEKAKSQMTNMIKTTNEITN